MKLEEKFNSKLLVEGNTEVHVFLALIQAHSINRHFDIRDCNGNDKLVKQITTQLKQKDIKTVGIVLDADDNLDGVWNSIRHRLLDLGYAAPLHQPTTGFIHPALNNYPKVGVWIMPDNLSGGMIEDLAKNLIPNNEPLKSHVESVLSELEGLGYNKYGAVHRAKAYIHTFLAWQEQPGEPLGRSITMNYLNPSAPQGVALATWLNSLFNT